MKKKILILGISGFLGYNLAKKCLNLNWRVYGVSKSKPKKIRYLKKINYIHFDLSKRWNFKKLNQFSFDAVVNLSGYVEHKNFKLINKGHFETVKNLLSYFKKKKIKSFIQIGSSAEYGNLKAPHFERSFCKPRGKYGKSKLKSTRYLLGEKNFPVTILRLYQVYGPYQDPNRFMSQLIISSLKKKEFATSKGIQCRDFIYVDDVVKAILKIIKNERKDNKIINIGFGKSIKLKTIMKIVKKETKFFLPRYGQVRLRKGELMNSYPNIDRAKKILNWEPKVSIVKGIRKTILFYRKNIKLY